jgi:hypothetical protein
VNNTSCIRYSLYYFASLYGYISCPLFYETDYQITKSCMILKPGVNVTKLFSSSLTKRPKNLEHLSKAILSCLVYNPQVRLGAFLQRASARRSTWVGSGLTYKYKERQQSFSVTNILAFSSVTKRAL